MNLVDVVLQAVQGHIKLHDGGDGNDGPGFRNAELDNLVLPGNQGIVELLQNHRALAPILFGPGALVERFPGGGNGGIGVGGRSNRYLADGFLGGRVNHGIGFAAYGLYPASTDVQ